MIATATLVAIAAVAAIAGSAVSAVGMYNQGQAQKKMGEYNAQIQANNALMKTQQAQYEAAQLKQRNQRLAGAQAAAASKSGLDISGSVSDVMNDSAVQGEMNVLSAIYKGQVGASESDSAANMSRAQGSSAESQSYWGAAGTLLGGAGTAIGYAGRRKMGADDGYPMVS